MVVWDQNVAKNAKIRAAPAAGRSWLPNLRATRKTRVTASAPKKAAIRFSR